MSMKESLSNTSGLNETDSSRSLDDLNLDMLKIRIPSLCILVIQIFTGIFGNGLVIRIYWKSLCLRSELFYFIPWLAFFDINAIVAGGTLSILEDLFSANFPCLYLCQVLWFCMIFFTATGASCLFIIALQRYLYVFQKPVLTLKWRRLFILFAFIIATVVASPVFLLVDLREVSILGVNGRVCGDTLKYDIHEYKYSYFHFLLSLVAFNIIVITFLYVRIGLKTSKLLSATANPYQGRRAGRNFTLMYIVVFIVYSVAYLPSNVILVLPDDTKTTLLHNYDNKFEMNVVLVFHRMFMFSHVLNPLILFMFHAKFRKEMRVLLKNCKICCAKVIEAKDLRNNVN